MVIPDYELHYDLAESINILDVLQSIEQDLSSMNSLHNWDDKWSLDPVKTLARFARRELDRLSQRAASHIINFSSLDRVWTVVTDLAVLILSGSDTDGMMVTQYLA